VCLGSKLYCVVVQDARPDALTFYNLNAVNVDRAAILDGIVTSRDRTTEAAAVAYRTFFFRMNEATDDAALADARRRVAALNAMDLAARLPAAILEAFTSEATATASPSRIRLAPGQSWSCNDQELREPGFAVQAQAWAAVRALFEEAMAPA
jgi:hypothetical protein